MEHIISSNLTEIDTNNFKLLEQKNRFNKINYNAQCKVTSFPELIYSPEIRSIGTITSHVNTSDLNDPIWFANCIFDAVNYINDGKITGDIILYLHSKPVSFLKEIVKELGYGITGCDYENLLTLIYYSLAVGINIDIDLDLRNFLVINDTKTIIQKYEEVSGNKWTTSADRATIFYCFFNKCNLPIIIDYTTTDKYKQLLTVNYKDIHKKCKYLYNYINSFLSPIRYMCSLPTSILEPYLYMSDEQTVQIMKNIKYIPIDFICYKDYRFYEYSNDDNFIEVLYNRITNNTKTLIKCFYKDLIYYKNLIIHPKNMDTDINDLQNCTDLQLLNYYKPALNYSSRATLISEIINSSTAPHWRLNFPFHNINPDINMISMTSRTITDIDPLFSYGTLRNYCSYNLSELVECLKIGFLKPDYKNNTDVFSIQAIMCLDSYINDIPEFITLKNITTNLLANFKNIEHRIKYCAQIYADATDKRCYDDFLINIFFSGMYSKYWTGPGNEYPLIWKDLSSDKHKYNDREIKCNHIFNLMLQTSADIKFQDWKMLIPRIDYDWNKDTYILGTESILEIINQTSIGKFCLSNFSKVGISTGFATFKLICGLQDINEINKFIRSKYPDHNYDFIPKSVTDSDHVDYSIKFKNY